MCPCSGFLLIFMDCSLSPVQFKVLRLFFDKGQRSAANTFVNKMRLDIFVLFNIFSYFRFASYSEFLNLFFCEWDELIHIHI